MRRSLACLFAFAVLAGADFYDDFNDGSLEGWLPRCASATWWASDGMAYGSTSYTPAALVPPGATSYEDCVLATSAIGTHAFGMVARLSDQDTGVCAYVSPNADLARIRYITAGGLGATLSSISAPFPSGVPYELTFTCSGQNLSFQIFIPSTSQSWSFGAVDVLTTEGEVGLLMGDESLAGWDYLEVTGQEAGQGSLEPVSESVDDDSGGESSGDGDGAFEVGETIELILEIANNGTTPLSGLSAILESLSPQVTITDGYENYYLIPAGGTGTCEEDFGLTALSGGPASGVYPMLLTLYASGEPIAEINFDIPVGCGITTDVEGSQPSWSNISLANGWGNNWHLSTARNHTAGGSQSFKCGDTGSGDYDNLLYCSETSQWFNVPHDGQLDFWMWTDAQVSSGNLPQALDGGLVQLGQFDTWVTIDPAAGYTFEIPAGTSGPFPPATQVFSGTYSWQHLVFDLPDELAGPRKLRFVFGTDAAGTREGWFIDDVNLTGPSGIGEGSSGDTMLPLGAFSTPNPFTDIVSVSISGTDAGEASVRIFDLSGRMVAAFPPTGAQGSSALVTWDGRDSEGTAVAAGVYLARISTPGGEGALARLVRIR